MKVVVEMTSEEFQEFMAWKRDKDMYEKDIEKLHREIDLMAKQVNWSVAPDPKKPGKYKIIDQDHLSDLYDAASVVIGWEVE